MSIFNFLGDLIKPVTSLIDNLVTTDAEKGTLKNELTKIENTFAGKILEYEKSLMEAQAKSIVAEASGHSWLQRNWRPITMLTFLTLVVLDQTGQLAFRLAPEAWVLLQIGLGGYVIGRSAEKVIPGIIESAKTNGKK